jgi:hypothetical protein
MIASALGPDTLASQPYLWPCVVVRGRSEEALLGDQVLAEIEGRQRTFWNSCQLVQVLGTLCSIICAGEIAANVFKPGGWDFAELCKISLRVDDMTAATIQTLTNIS